MRLLTVLLLFLLQFSVVIAQQPTTYDVLKEYYNLAPFGATPRTGAQKAIDRIAFLGMPNLHPHGNNAIGAIGFHQYSQWFNATYPNGINTPLGGNFPQVQEIGPLGGTGAAVAGKSGQIHRITLHPAYGQNGNETLYACSSYGGLWKSTNNGFNWVNLNTDQGLPNTTVGDVAVAKDAGGNDVIFISSGHSDFKGLRSESTQVSGLMQFYSHGVYKSTDDGGTWTKLNDNLFSPGFMGKRDAIRRLVVHPSKPNLLVIATNSGVFYTNNSLSANPVWVNLNLHMIDTSQTAGDMGWRGLEFLPNNNNILYVSGAGGVAEVEFNTQSQNPTLVSIDYLMRWDDAGISGFKNLFNYPPAIGSYKKPYFWDQNCPNLLANETCSDYGTFLPYRANVAVAPDPNGCITNPNFPSIEQSVVYVYVFGFVRERFPRSNTANDCSNYWECPGATNPNYTCPFWRAAIAVYRFSHCDGLELIFTDFNHTSTTISKCKTGAGDFGEAYASCWLGMDISGNDVNKLVLSSMNGYRLNYTSKNLNVLPYGTTGPYGYWPDFHDFQSIPNTASAFAAHHGGVSFFEDSDINLASFRNLGINSFLTWDGDVNKTGKEGYGVIAHDNALGYKKNYPSADWRNINGVEGWGLTFLGHHSRFPFMHTKSGDIQTRKINSWGPVSDASLSSITLPLDPGDSEKSRLSRLPSIINPYNPDEFYVGASEIYKISDTANSCSANCMDLASDTWKTNLTTLDPWGGTYPRKSYENRVEAIQIPSSNPNYIYTLLGAGSGDAIPPPLVGNYKDILSKIYVSKTGFPSPTEAADVNQTERFKDITINPSSCSGITGTMPTNPMIFDIGVSHLDPEKIWAIAGGYDNRVRFFESTNAGTKWHLMDPNGDYTTGTFTGYPQSLPARRLFLQPGTEKPGTNSRPRMFVGTDAGIYYLNPDETEWRYYTGFPRATVTSMTHNPCDNTLFVTTFGRGSWKLALPDMEEPLETLTIINSNQTWNTNRSLITSILVKAGYTLIIGPSMTLRMPAESQIIVEPGARLIVRGTITAGCDDEFWDGIVAMGNSCTTQTQQNQAYVYINGGTLEHARTGITNWVRGDWNTIGGIITANGATFRNCGRGIEFYSNYPSYNNGTPGPCNPSVLPDYSGSVINSLFTTDDNFRAGSDGLNHVTLWKVKGVQFSGCDFEDLRTNKNWDQQYTRGIFSIDAHYRVLGRCNSVNPTTFPGNPSCAESNLDRCTFYGLGTGIEATSGNNFTKLAPLVDQAEFRSNIWGIHYNNSNHGWVSRSNFFLNPTDMPTDVSGDRRYWTQGIYNLKARYVSIKENFFDGQWMSGQGSNGVQWNNGGSIANKVYKNEFRSLRHGELYLSYNRGFGQQNIQGLQSKCNLRPSAYPMGEDGIRIQLGDQDEGIAYYQGSATQGQGGTFNQNSSLMDIDEFNNVSQMHWYHSGGLSEPIYTSPTVLVSPAPNPPSCTTEAVIGVYPGYQTDISVLKSQAITQFGEKQTELAGMLYNLHQLVDGGSTPALVNQIVNDWDQDAWMLRDSLMDYAPYVSTHALRQAALTGILPDAMLLELCLANIDATTSFSFINFLRYSIPNPMPEYMLELIITAWSDAGPLADLESQIGRLYFERDQSFGLMLNAYANDSILATDSIAYWHKQRNEVEDWYALADYYMLKGQTDSANAYFQSLDTLIPLEGYHREEWIEFSSWLNFEKTMVDSAYTMDRLPQDWIDSLLEFGSNHQGRSAQMARNVLCFFYDTCLALPSSPSPKPSPNPVDAAKGALDIPDCNIFPNPAETEVKFEYLQGVTATFRLFDLNGREVKRLDLKEMPAFYSVKLDGLPKATYIYKIVNKQDIPLCTGKLVVQ